MRGPLRVLRLWGAGTGRNAAYIGDAIHGGWWGWSCVAILLGGIRRIKFGIGA